VDRKKEQTAGKKRQTQPAYSEELKHYLRPSLHNGNRGAGEYTPTKKKLREEPSEKHHRVSGSLTTKKA